MAPGSSTTDSDLVAERLEKRMASMTDRVWDKVGELQDEVARLRDQEFDQVRRLAERAMEAADQAQGAPLVDVVAAAAVKDQVEPLRSQIDAVAAGLKRTQKSLEEQQERIQASIEEQVERIQKSLEEQQEQMEDGIAELSERIRSTEASADAVRKDIELLRASYKDRWDWENDLGGRVDQLSRRLESCVAEDALQQSLQALRTAVERQLKDNTSAVTELGMRIVQLDESLRKEAQKQAESAVTTSVNTSKEHLAVEADAIRKGVESQIETFREGMETILLATTANKDAIAKVSELQNSSQTRISDLQDELCQSVAIHTEHRKCLDALQEAVDSVAKRVDVADSTQTWVDCCTRQLGQRLDKCEEQQKLARDALSDLATQVAVEQTESINGVEKRCIAAMDARVATISAEVVDQMTADLAGVSRKLTESMDAKMAAAAERTDAKLATALERAEANLSAAAERLDGKLAATSKSFSERLDSDRSRCMDEVRSAARQADALLPRLQAAERQLEACSTRADAAEGHRAASEQRQEQRLAAQEQRLLAQVEQRLAAEEKRLLAQESQAAQQERQLLAQEQKLTAQERQLASHGQATQQLADQLAQVPSRVEARIEEARAALRDDMAASTRCALVSAFQGEMRLEAKMSQLSAASTSVPPPASWDSQLGQLLVPPSPAPPQSRTVAGTPPLPPRPPSSSSLGHSAAMAFPPRGEAQQAAVAARPPSPRLQMPQGPAHVAAAALLAGLPGMGVPATQQLGHASTARFGLGSLVASEAGSLGA